MAHDSRGAWLDCWRDAVQDPRGQRSALVLGDPSLPLARLDDAGIGTVADEFNPQVGVGTALPGLADARPDWRGRRYLNAGALWIPVAMLAVMRDGVRRAVATGRRFIHHNDQDALNLWLLTDHGPAAAVGVQSLRGRPVAGARGLVRRVVRRPLRSHRASLLHYVGPNKPWLPDCPVTEDVRTYRLHQADTARCVRRLGDLGVGMAGQQ